MQNTAKVRLAKLYHKVCEHKNLYPKTETSLLWTHCSQILPAFSLFDFHVYLQ